MKSYNYPDDPTPPDSVVATLCNLNREWIGALRTLRGGTPVIDDTLRLNLVALMDQLSTWDTLRTHVPEAVADIDAAQHIYDAWDRALLASDNNDTAAANGAMAEAERRLNDLPAESPDDCIS